jgi:hypothetical protein
MRGSDQRPGSLFSIDPRAKRAEVSTRLAVAIAAKHNFAIAQHKQPVNLPRDMRTLAATGALTMLSLPKVCRDVFRIHILQGWAPP